MSNQRYIESNGCYCEKQIDADELSVESSQLDSGEHLQKTSIPKSLPMPSDNQVCSKRYLELKKLCLLAITVEQQSLLGVPREDRIKFSQEYAPFKPENMANWQEAAKLGILNGCYLYGKCLLNSGQTEQGISWLLIAVGQCHEQAKRTLGDYLLDHGQCREGLQFLQEAADGGDGYACERLAHLHMDGDCVSKSRPKYRYYLKRAVSLGNHNAEVFLKDDELTSSW